MATQYANGRIVTDGLVLSLDASDLNSYPGSGTTWNDLAGSNNGTLNNGPTFDSNGNASSIVLDGVNDKITIQNSPTLQITEDITLMTWVRLDGEDSVRDLIAKRQGSDSLREFELRVDLGLLRFLDSGNKTYQNGNITPTDGIIQHYTVVRRINLNEIEFFINGNSDGVVSHSTTINTTTADIGIGCRHDSTFGLNPVTFYNTQIYNRALSAEEVAQNYSAQKSRFGL